jgi:hypothetical protein
MGSKEIHADPGLLKMRYLVGPSFRAIAPMNKKYQV